MTGGDVENQEWPADSWVSPEKVSGWGVGGGANSSCVAPGARMLLYNETPPL
jgi:hypothetical protein